MEIYKVGGAVRDEMLGIEAKDRDWVVVGSTPQEMKAKGFKPIGKEFPIFLHPKTREEYALARTEKKTGPGYRGFHITISEKVTLLDDLKRRDITINAMARDKDGNLIDPFNGTKDLKNGILRHIGPAFSEDPVRILRLARFSAKLGFQVAPETMRLMRLMARSGELNYLMPDRVRQEIFKGLMEKKPVNMFKVLCECNAIAQLFPELDGVVYKSNVRTGNCALLSTATTILNYCIAHNHPLEVRLAALIAANPHEASMNHILKEDSKKKYIDRINSLDQKLNLSKADYSLALLTGELYDLVISAASAPTETLLKIFYQSDYFRKPDRFKNLLMACETIFQGLNEANSEKYQSTELLLAMTKELQKANPKKIIDDNNDKKNIAQAIRKERLNLLRTYQMKLKN